VTLDDRYRVYIGKAERHEAFSTVLVGNQIEYRRFRTMEA
jgi:hypothetical protein